METFGEWLRGQRAIKKLTREEFAKRVGCSVSALRKIEDGERRPSTQLAELMANSLNFSPDEHETFVRVARGELSVNRLYTALNQVIASKTSRISLPISPTPFVGRQREIEHLSQLLRDPHCRLLTLVGQGGIGKTRLAIETAAQVQALFSDGVYFVSLASATSTRYIAPMIADSVGFAFHPASPADPNTQLFGYLKEKQALLLIDNLEPLLTEPGIELLADVLAHAPRVKLLATSRGSLGLQDEWVFEVQGLPIPENINAEGTEQNAAVELFLQRARRAHVGFVFTMQDYPSILRICHLVDGMPLGIELAASWVRILSCEEIAREIEQDLDFLAVSARNIPVRHQSMRSVFNQSWKLLTEEEQRNLLRLSVFRGGFRRDAAEHVAEATLAMLFTLVTKSLIRRSGTGRYDLHELVRQFAAEQLAGRSGEQSSIQAYHAKYYLTFFSHADGRLRSSAQLETLAELTAEMDNFRVAWDWAVNQGEFALIEQTIHTFIRLYDTRGWFQEGLDTLDSAINTLVISEGQSPLDRKNKIALGHLLATRSWLAYRRANYDQAQRMLEHSLEILRPLNEPQVLVEAITYLGRVMEMTGNYTRAVELYSEGLETATAIGDRWFKAVCFTLHTSLVGLTFGTLEPVPTYERLKSAVAEWRIIGDPRLIALALDFLSRSALRLGKYNEARAALEETTVLNHSIGFGWGMGTAYSGLGKVAQMQGKHQEAVTMYRKSLEIFMELGGTWFVARVLAEMGESILAAGDPTEASLVWGESLRMASDIHGTPVALEALAGFASLRAKQGDRERALELMLVVLNHPASSQENKDRVTRLRDELESQLTSQQVESAQARAQSKTFEVIVDEVLNQV